jgi:hypothetical protein
LAPTFFANHQHSLAHEARPCEASGSYGTDKLRTCVVPIRVPPGTAPALYLGTARNDVLGCCLSIPESARLVRLPYLRTGCPIPDISEPGVLSHHSCPPR